VQGGPAPRHDTGDAAAPWRTTTTTYNAAGKPRVVTRPDGTTTTTAYDAVGRVSTVTSSSGQHVLTTYDLASRVTKITDRVSGTLDPSITVNRGPVVREQRTYYAGGLLRSLRRQEQHARLLLRRLQAVGAAPLPRLRLGRSWLRGVWLRRRPQSAPQADALAPQNLAHVRRAQPAADQGARRSAHYQLRLRPRGTPDRGAEEHRDGGAYHGLRHRRPAHGRVLARLRRDYGGARCQR
jgi:YD repeat-containing protein